jgi:membrane protein
MDADETGWMARWRNRLTRVAIVRPLWALYRGYSRRNGSLLSAGIAYYLLFSLAPLTFLTLRIVGHFVDPLVAAGQLREMLTTFLGRELADLFLSLFLRSSSPGWATQTAIIGGLLLLYGARGLVVRTQIAFNVMWDIRVKPSRFTFRRLLSRLLLYGLLLIPSAVLLFAVALQSRTGLLGAIIGRGFLLEVSQWIAGFLLTWGLLTLIFTVLPDIRISPRDCWKGALLTAVLCALGTRLYGAFMLWNDQGFGSVGALLALLIWADYMAIIVLLGVRLNRVTQHLSGKAVQPYEYAVHVEDPVLLGAAELDADDWARLYGGASGVLKRSRTRSKEKPDPGEPTGPPQDSPDS